MKCVFCNREYPLDQVVCVDCNEYKGMEFSSSTATTISSALNDAFALMAEARQHHKEVCEHENLAHTESSAHLAFCQDCELEFSCDCDNREGEE
jgi:hypothetical protein